MKKLFVVGGFVLAGAGILIGRGSKTVVAQTAGRVILPLQLEDYVGAPAHDNQEPAILVFEPLS
jgi:hypothetical protein